MKKFTPVLILSAIATTLFILWGLIPESVLPNRMLNPPKKITFIWGIIQSASTAILLANGGLKALQTSAVIAALPFAVIMNLMLFSLLKSLQEEKKIPK